MDPYIAKLIQRAEGKADTTNQVPDTTTPTTRQEVGVLKKYWKGERTFFLVRGRLTEQQVYALKANMQALALQMESGLLFPDARRRSSESAS